MIIKTEHKDYFINLICNLDPKCIEAFFKSDVVDEVSNEKLKEIQKDLRCAKYKSNLMDKVLSIVISLNNQDLTKKTALKTEKINNYLRICRNRLYIFESNLAYLLITETLNLQSTRILWFDDEYIKNLLVKYKNILEAYNEQYYYNENNGLTSKINKNGYMTVLPYTPHAVSEALNQNDKLKDSKRLIKM